ncbi:MAG TPA: hypothetical protein VMQ76_11790 [Terracidiphilus sp.]|nr:hypothetical protein [Terracidiphilus sp.]
MNQTTAQTTTAATKQDAIRALPTVRGFIGADQIEVIGRNCRGEERAFFFQMLADLAERINAMPKTHETDGQGAEAIAHLHYFTPSMDWYITEKDAGSLDDTPEDFQSQAFGVANLGYGPELGYISIRELLDNGAELDLYWHPRALAKIDGATK